MLMFCFSQILFSFAQDTQIKHNTLKRKQIKVMQCFKPGDPKVLFKKGHLISEISALGVLSKFTCVPISLG